MHEIIILAVITDIIIARAANKRGKLLPYCIAFWDYLTHSSCVSLPHAKYTK